MNQERGSLWNKWDLHVHTPASIVQHYGPNNDETWEKYISALESLPKKIKVLGINDYIFIDGYTRVKQEKEKGRIKNIETIFPVIELRLSKFGGTEGKLSRINFHVIFDDTVSPENISSQFISSLTSNYQITPKYKQVTQNWNAAPTKHSLEELGNMIISSVPEKEKQKFADPLTEGFNNINFELEHLQTLLKRHCFKNKYITGIGKTEWYAMKWTGQSIAEKKDIINSVDIVFTASSKPEEYNLSLDALTKNSVNNHLLDCSDAHYYKDDDKDCLGNCNTWIKGDTSFLGLKLALREFESRVYIGDEPEIMHQVRTRGSKYIDRVKIKKIPDVSLDEIWFDCDLPINPGLIALIGNKGSGKSALAEAIGLVCNTKRSKYFSFISTPKFLSKSKLKAKAFKATVTWCNNNSSEKTLSDEIDSSNEEYVQCIPQNYLESICNDINNDNFNQELERVIFSHIEPSERLDQSNLNELISFVTKSTKNKIDTIKKQISDTNNTLIDLENKCSGSYSQLLTSSYKKTLQQVKDLGKNRPIIKYIPTDNEDLKSTQSLIETLNSYIKEFQADIKQKEKTLNALKIWIAEIDSLEQEISTIEMQTNQLKDRFENLFKEIKLPYNETIIFRVDKERIHQRKEEIRNEISIITKETNKKTYESYPGIIRQLKEEVKLLSGKLDEPQRIERESKEAFERWKSDVLDLIGDYNKPETVKYFLKELKDLKNVPKQIEVEKNRRLELAEQIVKCLQGLCLEYVKSYRGVQGFIDNTEIAGKMGINFSVALTQKNFEEELLSHIKGNVSSSFSPSKSEKSYIQLALEKCDFSDTNSVKEFLNTIDKLMHFNKNDNDKETEIDKILRKGHSLLAVYDFVFGLSYIKPMYLLKYGNKSLDELSPGEKGIILLIFYLLVDKNEDPLIVDQPEDNLDNKTIVEVLVECIKDARQRRQIIMVTHNPNLAVVCDADQIISCTIDKLHGNKVTYSCGALENPLINPEVVDILEGTKLAFTNRGGKYIGIGQ
jgi:ABC-type lipoprotein export system ATPase subunit